MPTIVALTAALLAASPCPEFLTLRELKTPTVVRIILEADAPDETELPLIGATDVNRLWVTARVEHVTRGTFPIAQGERFRLALHSIALTVGYDRAGEVVDIGWDGEQLRELVPARDHFLQVRARVEATVDPISTAVQLENRADRYLRIKVEETVGESPEFRPGSVVIVSAQAARKLEPGRSYCMVLLRRVAGSEREYRLTVSAAL